MLSAMNLENWKLLPHPITYLLLFCWVGCSCCTPVCSGRFPPNTSSSDRHRLLSNYQAPFVRLRGMIRVRFRVVHPLADICVRQETYPYVPTSI